MEAALQGLQGRMQKGSTPAQVLQALRGFAPKVRLRFASAMSWSHVRHRPIILAAPLRLPSPS